MAVILMGQDIFIYLLYHFHGDPFAEQDKGTCIKRGSILISRKADKILQIWVFRDLLHQLPVAAEIFKIDEC